MAKKGDPILRKNRALCVIYSWMLSWGIDARLPESPDEGDIVVAGRRVVLREDREAGDFDFALSPDAVLGFDLKTVLGELYRLTQFLGRGMPAGFRNCSGNTRASPDDYLAVSMRLTPFSRTPNLPEAELTRWLPTLKREADRATRRCQHILTNMSLDRSDIYNIGLVYLTNFLSRQRPLDNEKVAGQQLTMWLLQEYGRWADVTIRHLNKNMSARFAVGLPLEETVGSPHPLACVKGAEYEDSGEGYLKGRTIVGSYVMEYDRQVDESAEAEHEEPVFQSLEEETRYHRKEAIREGRYHAKRRRNAQKALDMALNEMPHDRMVFVLDEVAQSIFQHPDARAEATRQLAMHREACVSCQVKTSIGRETSTKTPAHTESAAPT